jgi:hypothetical protein
MTVSHGEICPAASPSGAASASVEASAIGSNFVGWLIQTACASVLEGMCETFADPRGLTSQRIPQIASRLGFSLNSTQNSLILKVRQREYKLSPARNVARRRRIGV